LNHPVQSKPASLLAKIGVERDRLKPIALEPMGAARCRAFLPPPPLLMSRVRPRRRGDAKPPGDAGNEEKGKGAKPRSRRGSFLL
jgi:hypothetical protein